MDTFEGIFPNLLKLSAQALSISATVFTFLKDFLKITLLPGPKQSQYDLSRGKHVRNKILISATINFSGSSPHLRISLFLSEFACGPRFKLLTCLVHKICKKDDACFILESYF